MIKTRSLAQKLIQGGNVRVDGVRTHKSAAMVAVGATLTIAYADRIIILKILQPGMRRGPAKEAQLLFEDFSPPPIPKKTSPASNGTATREPGAGRPTKKQRRQTDQLHGR